MATEDVTTEDRDVPNFEATADLPDEVLDVLANLADYPPEAFDKLIADIGEQERSLSRKKAMFLSIRRMVKNGGTEMLTEGGKPQTARTRLDKTKQRMLILKVVKEATEQGVEKINRPYVDEQFFEFFGQDRNTTPILNELVKEGNLARPERGEFVITEQGDELLSEYKGFDAQTADDVITGIDDE